MSLLVESIWIKDSVIMNMAYHQQRYNSTLKQLYPHALPSDLRTFIDPQLCASNETKCRIVYSDTIHKVEYIDYNRKTIDSLKCISAKDIRYLYKYEERPALDALFDMRESCDEIIIVLNGLITDAYYFNLVFENDYGLFTPDNPLLAGTMRQYLLDNGVIKLASIKSANLGYFKKIHLINALNPLGCQVINVKNVL